MLLNEKMLKYQIHKLSKGGKEARSVLLEDILTSDVFGLMSYFPYESLLKPFLERISTKNPHSIFSVPAGDPIRRFNFWENINWPKSPFPRLGRNVIEPDIIIEWDDTLLFIEAKFISPTDPEQLLRELLIGIKQTNEQKRFFLLLIDKNLSSPNVSSRDHSSRISILEYLESRLKELNLSDEIKDVSNYFLWINWQTFYLLINEFLEKNKNIETSTFDFMAERILKDLIELLQKKGLIPYENLDLSLFDSKVVDPYFLGDLGMRIRKRYSDISDVSIDLSDLNKISYVRDKNDSIEFLSSINLNSNSLDFISVNRKIM